MLPLLQIAGSDGPTRVRDHLEHLGDEFGLEGAERSELLLSGQQTVLSNRAHWAVTYMVKAGLLERSKRGVFAVTDEGRAVLAKNPTAITLDMLSAYASFRDFREGKGGGTSPGQSALSEAEKAGATEQGTPEDRINAAVTELHAEVQEELLERVLQAEPVFFEHLILKLMAAMGYGGAGESRHLGKSHDGGVDGIIYEDPLGLDVVYLQAKRYASGNTIGVEQIRSFAGSLDERGATKGVFVTTSQFAAGATQYAERSPKRLILIDGDELTDLLVRYGVGVRTFHAIELKRVDADFFDAEE